MKGKLSWRNLNHRQRITSGKYGKNETLFRNMCFCSFLNSQFFFECTVNCVRVQLKLNLNLCLCFMMHLSTFTDIFIYCLLCKYIYYIYHTEAVESHIYRMHVNINRYIIPQSVSVPIEKGPLGTV